MIGARVREKRHFSRALVNDKVKRAGKSRARSISKISRFIHRARVKCSRNRYDGHLRDDKFRASRGYNLIRIHLS